MAHYIIVSRLNGLVLDVQGASTDAGTHVIMYRNHGHSNQQWYDDHATGTIRTKLNGYCLDIEGDQRLRIMPYQQGDPNQQWERDSQGFIRNRVNRNKVLDILNANHDEGAHIGAWDINNGPNQLWNYEGPGAAIFHRRDFYIVSEMNGKVLDVKGGNGKPGDDIVTWPRHSTPNKNQLWYSDHQGIIRSAINDFAIDGAPGHKVEVQPYNGSAHQQWVFENKKIVNRASGEVLDIYGEHDRDGAEVGSYHWKDSHNQHWRQEFL